MCSFSFLYTIFPALCFLLKRAHLYVATFGLGPTVNTWMIEFSFSGTWCSRGHEWSLLHSLQWECPHFRRRADDLLWNLWNGVSEQELHTNRCANPQESAMSVSCRQSFSIVRTMRGLLDQPAASYHPHSEYHAVNMCPVFIILLLGGDFVNKSIQ